MANFLHSAFKKDIKNSQKCYSVKVSEKLDIDLIMVVVMFVNCLGKVFGKNKFQVVRQIILKYSAWKYYDLNKIKLKLIKREFLAVTHG